MKTKLYKIKGTFEYANAKEIYCHLPDGIKSKIENLVSKEIYSALVFDIYVLDNIEKYCDDFFNCKERGLSYELGCYFQTREYEHDGMIDSDIQKFSALLNVYDKVSFPKECALVQSLIASLFEFKESWHNYEKTNPELFECE